MKQMILAATLLIPAFAFAQGQGYQVQIKKGEMHCADCVKEVSDALKSLPDVEQDSVKVVLDKNLATLQVKDTKKVSVNDIKAAVKKAGFDVTSVKEMAPSHKLDNLEMKAGDLKTNENN